MRPQVRAVPPHTITLPPSPRALKLSSENALDRPVAYALSTRTPTPLRQLDVPEMGMGAVVRVVRGRRGQLDGILIPKGGPHLGGLAQTSVSYVS